MACALASLPGFSARAWAQEPDWSKIEIKSEKVAGGVYMLYGVGGFSGGNIGVSVGRGRHRPGGRRFRSARPQDRSGPQGHH
jgi:hypothetical protein